MFFETTQVEAFTFLRTLLNYKTCHKSLCKPQTKTKIPNLYHNVIIIRNVVSYYQKKKKKTNNNYTIPVIMLIITYLLLFMKYIITL